MVSGLLRINRGFLFTAKHLLFHPWKVIREYLKGKRVNYTSPVNMLVILCFLGTLVSGLFFSEPQNTTDVLNVTNSSVGYCILYAYCRRSVFLYRDWTWTNSVNLISFKVSLQNQFVSNNRLFVSKNIQTKLFSVTL